MQNIKREGSSYSVTYNKPKTRKGTHYNIKWLIGCSRYNSALNPQLLDENHQSMSTK